MNIVSLAHQIAKAIALLCLEKQAVILGSGECETMKWFFWTLIFLAFFTPIIFMGKGIDHLDIMKDRYKRALDSGASSAARAVIYDDENSLEQTAIGFGINEEHANNIVINKDNALNWFYRVFYRNLGIQEDIVAQEKIKRYIPMKAIVGFDKLMIADVNDNWILEENYEMEFKGSIYKFTLSDQVMKKSSGNWARDIDFGIQPQEREELVNRFIRDKLNYFLSNREIDESNYEYYVNISTRESDKVTENISGISFIVMTEGLPLPSLNPWKSEKFYAFALGGTEINRK
jgi:hypothetical protein